jgi:hypothetical protein
VPWILLALTAAAPGAAGAAEDERALSLSLGYAAFHLDERSPQGAQLGLVFERGVSDAVNLRAAAAAGLHADAGSAVGSAQAVLGITYLIDVLKYVPYVSAGAGALFVAGGALDSGLQPMIELGLGLDVLSSRTFSWGLELRAGAFLEGGGLLSAGVRTSWRWGFF